MTDGDIARSRVAGLPTSVNGASSARVRNTDTDWPAGDDDPGKPPDVDDHEPLLDLGMAPNQQPLSPDVRDSYERINFSALGDATSTLALIGGLL